MPFMGCGMDTEQCYPLLHNAGDDFAILIEMDLFAGKVLCGKRKPFEVLFTVTCQPEAYFTHGTGSGAFGSSVVEAFPIDSLHHKGWYLMSMEQVTQGIQQTGWCTVIVRDLLSKGYFHAYPLYQKPILRLLEVRLVLVNSS